MLPAAEIPPSGKVVFTDGSITLGTVNLSGGTAALTTTALSAGTHNNIQATYQGDGNFIAGSFDTLPSFTVTSFMASSSDTVGGHLRLDPRVRFA